MAQCLKVNYLLTELPRYSVHLTLVLVHREWKLEQCTCHDRGFVDHPCRSWCLLLRLCTSVKWTNMKNMGSPCGTRCFFFFILLRTCLSAKAWFGFLLNLISTYLSKIYQHLCCFSQLFFLCVEALTIFGPCLSCALCTGKPWSAEFRQRGVFQGCYVHTTSWPHFTSLQWRLNAFVDVVWWIGVEAPRN